MAQEWALGLYHSKAWLDCRRAFLTSKHWLCERCGEAANTAHHKTYLTPENIHDPNVTLNWDNLEALCERCHQHEHYLVGGDEVAAEGLGWDSEGNLVKVATRAEAGATGGR